MKKLLIGIAAMSMLAGAASADTVTGVYSASSDSNHINVGPNLLWIPFGPHADGIWKPSIGINSFMGGIRVTFNGLTNLVKNPKYNPNGEYGNIDANNVVNLTPPDHKPGTDDPNPSVKMGVFNFKKIADNNAEVYFGEWQAKENGAVNPNTKTVYYSGKNRTANMPTTGNATYTVEGINNYAQNGLMTGTFNANFGTNKLTGSIANSAVTVGVNANINTIDASFAGNATANGVAGHAQGNFFGDGAAQLAGIAKFNNRRDLDTAFGGVKQ